MDGTTAPPARPNLALRILRFPITLIILEAIVFILIGGVLEAPSVSKKVGLTPVGFFLFVVAGSAVLILVWKALRRWLEGERDREFTLPGAGKELGSGLLAGALLFSLMTGLVALLGGLDVVGTRPFARTQFWEWAALGVASGIFEETLFRGVLLRQLERLVGTWWALAATSVLFGAVHMLNPDATWTGAISIMIEAGILLGGAYLYTRRLWLAAAVERLASRLTAAPQAPQTPTNPINPKPVSKAPAPAPTVSGRSPTEVPPEKLTDDEWFKREHAKRAKSK